MNRTEPSKCGRYWDQLSTRSPRTGSRAEGICSFADKEKQKRGSGSPLRCQDTESSAPPSPHWAAPHSQALAVQEEGGPVQPGVNCQIADKLLAAGMEKPPVPG